MQQLDLFGGRAARDEGIARVTDHGGDWMDVAFGYLVQFTLPGCDHTGESIRLQLIAAGCPPPHHHNAWGALIRQAVVKRILTDTGRHSWAKGTKSHARRIIVYRRNTL